MMHKIEVFVNGVKHDLKDDDVKVGYLIELGGGKPSEYELQRRDGEGRIVQTYKNPDEVIEVHNGEHFTTRFTGPINTS